MLSYEEQRAQNIKDNEALLLSLGLHIPSAKPVKAKAAVIKRPVLAKKKLVPAVVIPIRRADGPGIKHEDGEGDGRRRSARSRKSVTYTDEGMEETARESYRRQSSGVGGRKRARDDSDGVDEADYVDYVDDETRQRNAARLGVRTQDPYVSPERRHMDFVIIATIDDRKRFGHIPGVEVGTWWASRMECSTAAIHAPTVAGISGNSEDGAWSVALSGGYPDDVDLGEAFTYTGSGGRDLRGTKQNPKNLRSAPQTFDQSFDNPKNAALKKSAETRRPVRVIRGFKLDSPYAPAEGYRYDGLYIVEKAWMGKGLTKGLQVCRYAFKRLPGQPELPIRAEEEEADGED